MLGGGGSDLPVKDIDSRSCTRKHRRVVEKVNVLYDCAVPRPRVMYNIATTYFGMVLEILESRAVDVFKM